MGQVRYLFQEFGINQIGSSKHTDKIEARAGCEETGVAATWHNTGKML